MGYIYKIQNKLDNKIYIGQTIRNLEDRKYEHFIKNKSNCRYLKSAINKYGKENFSFSLLCIVFDDCLNSQEEHYIMKYNSIVPNGYNLKLGGNNGKHHEETKQKISNSLKNRSDIKHSRHFFGKHHTEETKSIIREKLIGKKHSIEQINKQIKYIVLQYDINGTLLNEFYGTTSAGNHVGVGKNSIINCCNGKSKTSMGFVWKYKQ